MDAESAAASVLGSLDSLLLLLGDPVQDRLFRYEKRQPGSIQRSLLRTQGRLTSKLAHQDNAHLKVMMLGPVADSLERRIGEIAAPESGVLSVVERRLDGESESLRGSALAARQRVASQLNRAQTMMVSRTNLQSAHARLMGRLSGDVMIDQQVRREITDVENQLANIHREESQIVEGLQSEADALRQRLDGMIQTFSGYVRLGFTSRNAAEIRQPRTIQQVIEMSIQERANWWSSLTDEEKNRWIEKNFEILRNLDGIDGPSREKMQVNYIKSVIAKGGPELEMLERLGFVRDGEITRRFVFLDLDPDAPKYVTAHGCEDYKDIQYVIEGTGTNPGNPGGMGNLDKTDEKAASLKGRTPVCRTFLVVRNVEFPANILTAAISAEFTPADEVTILKLMGGFTASGAGTTGTSLRMHSAGNSFLPNLTQENREKYGIRMNAVIMDDAAMDMAEWSFDGLPTDIPIMYVIQAGPVSTAIRIRYGTDLIVLGHENVTFYDYTDSPNQEAWLKQAPHLEYTPWSDPLAFPKRLVEGSNAIWEGSIKYPYARFIRDGLLENRHSDGWSNELQWIEEAAFIETKKVV